MPAAVTLPNAIETYQAAVTANPNSAEAYSNLGWGYYGQRKFDEAITAFRQALALDRNYTDGHYGLGLTLKESGAGKEAVLAFEAVLKLAPQDANNIRGQMVSRLARGHINRINSGDWGLNTDIIRPVS
jgi:tetratricopeptide (TPR) repeat protein